MQSSDVFPGSRRLGRLLFEPSDAASSHETRIDAVLAEFDGRLVELEKRMDEVDAERPEHTAVRGWVAFVADSTGYTLREFDEPDPAIGQVVRLDAGRARVTGFRHSPFPADPRPCAIAELLFEPGSSMRAAGSDASESGELEDPASWVHEEYTRQSGQL